jgi:formylglycine-generating enzyme
MLQSLLLAVTATACAKPRDTKADAAGGDLPSVTASASASSTASATAAPLPVTASPGREWRSPSLGVMMWIPDGNFTMGSPSTEQGRYKDEVPHPVTLTRGFWMMEGEVTERMWSTVMGADAEHLSGSADHPATSVSWEEAQAFATKSGARDHETYRLPSEAEWERAARGERAQLYAGSDVAEDVGWVTSNSGGQLHPPCGRARNGFGLCDMTGNVWEWVGDWYGPYEATATDPTGPSSGQFRVVRGCGVSVASRNMRVARRDEATPDARSPATGFRLVRPR